MNLLEANGKALLAAHGIAIPRGALWPQMPPGDGALVVKAQIPAGGRGKAGGIRFAAGPEEAGHAARSLLGTTIAGHRVDAVYVEEKLAIDHEHYLAVTIDRDRRCPVMIASPSGGMDIEAVDRDRILRLPIDPLLGFRAFHGTRIARFLDGGALAPTFAETAEALYRLAMAQDAELVEVNPLVVAGDAVIAADAKIVLDDNARFRQTGHAQADGASGASALEARIAEAGAVGVEIDADGDVVAVVSGAGLMMATLDLLRSAGLKVRAVVDLGGTVLAGGEGLRRVLAAVAPLKPRITFINAFLQTALCDVFADSLAAAHAGTALAGKVVVRLKGRRAEAGQARLEPLGFTVHEDLRPAIGALTLAQEA